jgi:hypothetical protein
MRIALWVRTGGQDKPPPSEARSFSAVSRRAVGDIYLVRRKEKIDYDVGVSENSPAAAWRCGKE